VTNIPVFLGLDGTLATNNGMPRPGLRLFLASLAKLSSNVFIWDVRSPSQIRARLKDLEYQTGYLTFSGVLSKGRGFPRNVLSYYVDCDEALIVEAESHEWGAYWVPPFDGSSGDDYLAQALFQVQDYAARYANL